MSIFSQDLDKGGILRDVINFKEFSYANGSSIYHDIYACETVNPRDEYDNFLFINAPEFDHDSYWPLYPDGFLCNMGKIEYSQIFSQEFQNRYHIMNSPNLNDITLAAMEGHIETLFVPYYSSWSWEMDDVKKILSEFPEFENRLIRDTDWWKLVKSAIQDGVQNALDPKLNAKVFVTGFDHSLGNTTNGVISNRFFHHT